MVLHLCIDGNIIVSTKDYGLHDVPTHSCIKECFCTLDYGLALPILKGRSPGIRGGNFSGNPWLLVSFFSSKLVKIPLLLRRKGSVLVLFLIRTPSSRGRIHHYDSGCLHGSGLHLFGLALLLCKLLSKRFIHKILLYTCNELHVRYEYIENHKEGEISLNLPLEVLFPLEGISSSLSLGSGSGSTVLLGLLLI